MARWSNQVTLRDRAIARSLPVLPRRLVRRLSMSYVAGDSLDAALGTIRSIAALGMATTVDVLGEAITTQQEAIATRDAYLDALDALKSVSVAVGGSDVVNVSIKLTALGLAFDEALALDSTQRIVERARNHGGFVRIDMEDTPNTDATLNLYERLRADGFDNVGVVVQAYLRRSADDVDRLCELGARVRVVKGIYREPARVAFADAGDIDSNFLALCARLAGAGCHTAFATHDDTLVTRLRELVTSLDIDRSRYEFQMLLGVREELRDKLRSASEPVRIYVPYGAKWYEYCLRRLRENPKIAGYVAGDLLRRGVPRQRAGKR